MADPVLVISGSEFACLCMVAAHAIGENMPKSFQDNVDVTASQVAQLLSKLNHFFGTVEVPSTANAEVALTFRKGTIARAHQPCFLAADEFVAIVHWITLSASDKELRKMAFRPNTSPVVEPLLRAVNSLHAYLSVEGLPATDASVRLDISNFTGDAKTVN